MRHYIALLFPEIFILYLSMILWLGRERILRGALRKVSRSMRDAADRRAEDRHRSLAVSVRRQGVLYRMEQRLLYSGLMGKIPFLTLELWTVGKVLLGLGTLLLLRLLGGTWQQGILGVLTVELAVYLWENLLMARNYEKTDEELLKFLDFLGSYSLTCGEVTAVLEQVSGYLEEPVRSVLEQCCYEAQVSGDTSIALLGTAEKLEHPKFKEFVRNLEISMRYSADFTVLVSQSRRSVREHMRLRQERKALAREAWINLLLLGAMTAVILKAAGALIGISVEQILFYTWVGRGAAGVVCGILALFYRQVRRIDTDG